MFVIPSKETKKFAQLNLGDTQGNLWSSFQVDTTTNLGRVKNKRAVSVLNGYDFENAHPGVDLTAAMAYTWYDFNNDGNLEFVTYMGQILISDSPTSTYNVDVTASSPVYSGFDIGNGDMVVFNDKLYVTTESELWEYDKGTGAWTQIDTGGNPSIGTGVHAMDTYGDRLYIIGADSTIVYSLDTSGVLVDTGSFTLDLGVFDARISWIRSGSNRIWVGMTTLVGSRGIIFEWDGQSENLWSKNYLLEAQGTAGCVIWNDIPYTLDTEGRLLAFNGSNFQEVARLPFIIDSAYPARYTVRQGTKLIHFNGIIYTNDRLIIALDPDLVTSDKFYGRSYSTRDNIPGGLWEYTKENGLLHLCSPTMNNFGDTDALDYGQPTVSIYGAVYDATPTDSVIPDITANYIFSTRSFENDGTTTSWGLYVDDIVGDLPKLAYIETAWMESDQVSDVWKAIVTKHKQFLSATDSIEVKYRTVNSPTSTDIGVTWVDNQNFTTTTAEAQYLEVGDEVTITFGIGAGDVAHVRAVVDNLGTYEVELDREMLAVTTGNAGLITFQKFKKLVQFTGADVAQYHNCPLPQQNKDIQVQFKIVMEWSGDNEFYELIVVNDTEQFAK